MKRDIDGLEECPDDPCIELPHPMQLDAYRAMTPAQRLDAAFELTDSLREILRGWCRAVDPAADPAEIDRRIAQRLLGNAR